MKWKRAMGDVERRDRSDAAVTVRRSMLGLFAASMLAACSSTPRLGSRDDEDPTGRLSDGLAREAAFVALGLVDTPYRYGGNTPQSGFDCSGLIVYAFRTATGYPLPRTVAQIAEVGQPVGISALRTGDLVFFDAPRRFSHAGIFVGSGRFVHAPSAGGRVRLDGVFTSYWRPRLSRIRRV